MQLVTMLMSRLLLKTRQILLGKYYQETQMKQFKEVLLVCQGFFNLSFGKYLVVFSVSRRASRIVLEKGF